MTAAVEPLSRRRRQRQPVKHRKTSEFSVISAQHQRLILEALIERMAIEQTAWKRRRLAWLTRRLAETLQVHERNGRAHQ